LHNLGIVPLLSDEWVSFTCI